METPARSAKGRVGVAQVVEMAERLDAGRDLGRLPVAPPEVAQIDVAASRRPERAAGSP